MSTGAVLHTRRQHGLLVAALEPPLKRHVVLSQTEATIEVGQRYYRLSTHQFPEVAPTPGYRLLTNFAQDPLPRWTFNIAKSKFERALGLARGKNALVIAYTWHGRAPARLWVRPLMPLRPVEGLMHEHGAMQQRVTLRSGEVEIQPAPHLPPVSFGHGGVFMGSPDWWRRFEYSEDRGAGLEFQEDMWTPGVFEFLLEPGRTEYLMVSVGPLPAEAPQAILQQAADHLLAQDPGPHSSPAVRALSVACDQFCAVDCERPATVAGYPTLEVRARDLVLSIPGLCLARGKVDQAKALIETAIGLQRGGFLADTLEQAHARRRSPLPDATLWLFEVARELSRVVDTDDEFLRRRLYPSLRRAFARFRVRWRRFAWLTADGLIANHDENRGLTWMDAHLGARLVTPRRGLAVEHQALWSKGCETLATLARRYGDEATALAAESCCSAARASFQQRFWCNETDYPFDCISEARDSADAWADPTIRPNAVIALAVDPELFDGWQAAAIIDRAQRELLTPNGLRSLSPRDPNYIGQFGASVEEYEMSYHQGTAWPHLMGFYVRACLGLRSREPEVIGELERQLLSLVDSSLVVSHVAQLAHGDPPHRLRGAPAYAVGASEMLRAVSELLASGQR
jgi:predicted glycogen debranching enzyme